MDTVSKESSPQLPRRIKAGFGVAELGITSVQILTQLYLLEFYTQTIGLIPSLAGIALAISVLWDAVSDPLMGILSDNTKSRWGRRRPFIILGSLTLAFSIGILFSPPNIQEQGILFLYLLGTFILLNTAMTILSVPHLALGGELSSHPEDRTEIFGWRLLFSNFGILFGMLLPALILQSLGDETKKENILQARYLSAWGVGILVFLSGIVTFWVTGSPKIPKRVHLTHKQNFTLKLMFKSSSQVLRNKIFLPLFLAFVIATFGRTFNTAIALFYYKFRLGLDESDIIIKILFPFFVIIILSIPFWLWLSKKYGKKYPAFFGILILGLSTVIAYPLYPYGNVYYPLITAVLGGICAGSIFLLDSLVADIVDHDELMTGEMKEGLFFGFWKMGTKFAQAIGLGVSGFILDGIGFDPSSQIQSAEVSFRLAMIFGPVVGGFFVLGAVTFLWMPLNEELHNRIKKLLHLKRKKRAGLIETTD